MPEIKDEAQRRARLDTLADMITLALGEDWNWLIVIGKPGDIESVNLLSNCPPESVGKLLKVINQRQAQGICPTEL